MNGTSLLADLRRAGTFWPHFGEPLPEQIAAPTGDTLHAVSLPNTALCADFLRSGDVWCGVAVAVDEPNIPVVFHAFRFADSDIVRLISADAASNLGRYTRYPRFGWIEVAWTQAANIELIEVQTNGVLWYGSGEFNKDTVSIVVMGLENVKRLASETDPPLTVPKELAVDDEQQ